MHIGGQEVVTGIIIALALLVVFSYYADLIGSGKPRYAADRKISPRDLARENYDIVDSHSNVSGRD